MDRRQPWENVDCLITFNNEIGNWFKTQTLDAYSGLSQGSKIEQFTVLYQHSILFAEVLDTLLTFKLIKVLLETKLSLNEDGKLSSESKKLELH